jgi:hypothetical protein
MDKNKLRIAPNSDAFYEKYGFTLTMTQKHPVFGDWMEFTGLEANYVSYLEREVEHLKKCFLESVRNNESYLARERYRLEDAIKKSQANAQQIQESENK